MVRSKFNIPSKSARKVGKYDKGLPERAFQLCLLGLVNMDLAVAFDVSIQTIEYWFRTWPEFKDAVIRGRIIADGKVAHSFYKRATGYEYTDQHIAITKDKQGKAVVHVTPIIRHQPPDTGAGIFWLTNRQSDYWTNSQRIDLNSTIKLKNLEDIDLSDMSMEELQLMKKLGLKTIPSASK